MIDEELLYPEMVGQMLLAMVQTFRPNSGLVSRSQTAFTRKAVWLRETNSGSSSVENMIYKKPAR